MNGLSDQALLREYTGCRSEAAFAELVRRHVDFIYSAALRMVHDAHLAEDVTQGVFVALARNAPQLTDRSVLSGWLHRTAQNIAAQSVRTDVRRRAREQEAALMNQLFAPESDALWEQLAPHLDAALGELSQASRDALMLRYFERKSAHEMAQILSISEEAAQKRVSRAVEQLRGSSVKRGLAVSASGLVLLITANAVQAAPATLAVAISTAAALVGSGISTSTAIAAAKTIGMTTLQRTLVAATIIAAFGTGIHQAHRASALQTQVRTLRQQQTALTAQIRQLQHERDEESNRLAAAREEISQSNSGDRQNALLKLRGEVGVLRQQLAAAEARSGASSTAFSKMLNDPAMREHVRQSQLNTIKTRYAALFNEMKLTSEQAEQFVQLRGAQLMEDCDRWFSVSRGTLSPAEIEQVRAERWSELEKQLQPLLGVNGCARLREFEREFPAHDTVDLLNGQLGGNQLSGEQATRLFQVVKAEPFDLIRGFSGGFDPAFLGSQEDIDSHLLKVAESNQRVMQQASSFLAPEQLAALSTVLTNGVNWRITQAAALIPKH